MTPVSVHRTTWTDILPETPQFRWARLHAQTRDVLRTPTGERTLHSVRLDVDIDEKTTIRRARSTSGSDVCDALVGKPCTKGFRALLNSLTWPTPTDRITRRMLWDLPIVAGLHHQTAMLDHPGAGHPVMLHLAGANQCSGWREDGQMFRSAAAHGGLLSMPLTPAVVPGLPVGSAPGFADRLAPMATRRTRTTTVTDTDSDSDSDSDSGQPYSITVAHRDSYADPDGVERRLHEWTTTALLDGTGRLRAVATAPGQLPWTECPIAGASTTALDGKTPAEVEDTVADWRGIGTCTHLNDAARLFADVGDLVASMRDRATA